MLSLTQKRWEIAPHFLSKGSGELIVTFLAEKRGLSSDAAFPSPYLFPDMERAKNRIEEAIQKNETVGIFGDYDCDGITAAAQLVRFFRRRNIEPVVRLPHRLNDGYGLKLSIIDELKEKNVSLLITVDTGISSEKEIEYAANVGIETIVTDHHHLPEVLPSAYAIIHPALAPQYPLPHPSGAGVAFQLVRALEKGSWSGQDTDTALAMIGTVGDLVELTGANRALVQKGLQEFMQLKDCPLATLRDSIRRTKEYSSRDIAFLIAPRINAAGRMDDPLIALHALLDGGVALETIANLNLDRQMQTASLYKQALASLKSQQESPFFCLEHADFPPGIIGLIAGKVVQEFGKPALIAHRKGDMCTASLRGIPGFNVMDGLVSCQSLLTSFGGHAMAAGCTFPLKHFEKIQEHLSRHLLETVPKENLVPTLLLDGEIMMEDITTEFAKHVKTLEPFGQGNTEPLFLLSGVMLTDPKTVGADGSHLQARLDDIKLIGFGLGKHTAHLEQRLDLACRVSLNEWNGRVVPQIVMEDLRIHREVDVAVR